LWHEVDHAIRDHDVGGVVGDRQVLDLPETEFDVCGSDRLGIGPRLRQHFMRHVDADHPAGRPDLLSRQKAIDPGAAAEIDNTSPGRIAASACGLPQPSPRSAPSSSEASSAAE
jgi:hypothetical protein